MKTITKRYIIAALLAVCISLIGAGCQTAKGFGEDVEDLGENIQGD